MVYNPKDKKFPADLSTPAIKVARRLQGLPKGQTYVVVLTKFTKEHWLLALIGEGKIEEPG